MFKIKRKWKRRDIILLLERLELYIAAGLPLNIALQTAAEGLPVWQRDDLITIKKSIEEGNSFSKVLEKKICLTQTLAGIIEHGQSIGELSRTLGQARQLLERQDELLKKCTSAMIYPAVIGTFAVLLTIGLVKGIMPEIIPMLKGLNVELPLLTRLTMALSEILTRYGHYIFLSMAILLSACVLLSKRYLLIKRLTHKCLGHIPLIGAMVRNYSLSVFLRSCGSLIDSGISVQQAYRKTASSIPLLTLRDKLASSSDDVSRGIPISSILRGHGIASYISPLVNAGEASGTLGISIIRASEILDRDIEHSLKKVTSLIEPLMMVAMGGVVGTIALSIMMPIYDVSKVLQR